MKYFFIIYVYNFGKNIYIKAKKNNRNYFNFVLYYQLIRIDFCVCKDWKNKIFIAFHGSFIPTRLKMAKIWRKKTCLLFYGCHGNEDAEIIPVISNDLRFDSRKSHHIWRKTDKNSRSGKKIYGRGHMGFIELMFA